MKIKTLLIVSLVVLLYNACSLKENTRATRFVQSFTTRYNVYFNGYEAYKEGKRIKEESYKDNYTELLPLFLIGSENNSLGKSNFERAVEKSEKAIKLHSIKKKPKLKLGKAKTEKQKNFVKRKEFNPFLYHAWLLLGKAKFEMGDYTDASSIFAYIVRLYDTQPAIYQEANAWLARCYTQMKWYYDAEEVLNKTQRDSLSLSVIPTLSFTQADLYLSTHQYSKAIPILKQVLKQIKSNQIKARTYFLLAQVYSLIGQKKEAFKALQSCLRLSPNYELAINARIFQSEVVEKKETTAILKKLQTMAKAKKNENYLSQIYYAMGNIYLAQNDTLKAIESYQQGEEKSKIDNISKGVLLLQLGNIYWEKQNFSGAQRCYAKVIGLLDKTHRSYEITNERSSVLDELVPYTTTIFLQDSLLNLAKLPKEELNKKIDLLIANYKAQEKERKRAEKDSLAQLRREANEVQESNEEATITSNSNMLPNSKDWYFYNTALVNQGKISFKKQWGNRKNEDNWRRKNKTVIDLEDNDKPEGALEDTLNHTINQLEQDSIKFFEEQRNENTKEEEQKLKEEDNPMHRAYYLKQIPFTKEQQEEAKVTLSNALYQAGIIEKDKLGDLNLASKTLLRLYDEFPLFEDKENLYYQLYLLFMRKGEEKKAEEFKNKLLKNYPQGNLSKMLANAQFLYFSKYGKQIEDSLYIQTYEAFLNKKYSKVLQIEKETSENFPEGENRPKFLLLKAFTLLQEKKDIQGKETLKVLLKTFPQSDVSELAGMLLKGLEEGKTIQHNNLTFTDLWTQRSQQLENDSATFNKKELTTDENTQFELLIFLNKDSVDVNNLLYELSVFNFSNFLVRNFIIEKNKIGQVLQLKVTGFRNYAEAYQYSQMLLQQKALWQMLKRTKLVLISEENLKLIGSLYSFSDYESFYMKHFKPLQASELHNLDTDDKKMQWEENLPKEAEQMNIKNSSESTNDTDIDKEEWYDIE